MRVIIAGGRTLDASAVLARLPEMVRRLQALSAEAEPITEIISGGCRGADAAGEQYARRCGIPLTIIRPDWVKHGRAAGPIRNAEMVRRSDALIVCWDGTSRGGADILRQATAAGLAIVDYRVGVHPR